MDCIKRMGYLYSMEDPLSSRIRSAVFEWFEIQAPLNNYVLDWKLLSSGFQFGNHTIPLIGAKGIWKPAKMSLPISISSVEKSEYDDQFIDQESLYYRYRGSDRNHADNKGLRSCMKQKIPLVYLHQVTKGRYFVAWPVFIIGDDPTNLRVIVSAEISEVLQRPEILEEPETDVRQKYQTRTIISRLHQGAFRERVLNAYKDQCCICRLKHRILLDAAHIIPDSLGGKPEVYNGLTLCKIHHTAYDQNILGVTPDYEVKIREDILHEIDGPMLKHGLQELNNIKLWTPRDSSKKPKKEFLDIRYQEFVTRQTA